MVEMSSKKTTEQTWNSKDQTWALANEGWTPKIKQQELQAFVHSFASIWSCPSCHGLSIPYPSFQAQLKYSLLWNQPWISQTRSHLSFYWVTKTLYFSGRACLILLQNLYACVQLVSPLIRAWTLRSVHQAQFWMPDMDSLWVSQYAAEY